MEEREMATTFIGAGKIILGLMMRVEGRVWGIFEMKNGA